MLPRLAALLDVARLRRAGFALAWNVQLQTTPGAITFGQGCGMGRGSILAADNGRLELGDSVRFGAYNYVAAADSFVRIGSRLLCSPFVSIVALNHSITNGVVSWTDLDQSKSGVTIGDDCWLATNSVILPGVSLGDRCVVGAGAVVTRSFPSDCTLVGVPAKAR